MEFLNVFASVDKDQDLVINEADLNAYAAEMKYEKAFTRKWLRLFDNDKDGRITFTEFCETLGLDEKIYEEKLRDVRKNIAEKKQQQLLLQQAQERADRANRRESRLPTRQQASFDKPTEQEVKENIQPQKPQRRVMTAQKTQDKEEAEVVEEEMVKPQVAQKIKSGLPDQKGGNTSPEQVQLEFDESDPRSIEVEFADMDPKELEEVKALLAAAQGSQQSRKSGESTAEFDRRMMHELDKKLGKTWQCQTNPELSPKEVNYQENCMAVLVAKPQKRVMVWKPEKAGGMCCAS